MNNSNFPCNIDSLTFPDRLNSEKIIKSSVYVERQLLGKTLKETTEYDQVIFFDKSPEKAFIDTNFFELGLDLSTNEQRALMAIQKLLTETDYKGHASEEYNLNSCQKYQVELKAPVLKITPSTFFEAFGVTKYVTKRGKREFGGIEKTNALASLFELENLRELWISKSFKDSKGNTKHNLILHKTSILSIIKVYSNLEDEEMNEVIDNSIEKSSPLKKIEYLSITPNPLLIKNIKGSYIIKSLSFIEDAKRIKKSGRLSRCEMLFLGSYLPWAARALKAKNAPKKEWVVTTTSESIAQRLRMYSLLRTHQKKRVRSHLNGAYELAKGCGYLVDYEIDKKGKTGPVDRLFLDSSKFSF